MISVADSEQKDVIQRDKVKRDVKMRTALRLMGRKRRRQSVLEK